MTDDAKPIETRTGTMKVCDLPDEGPWQLTIFGGKFLACSQISGLYEVVEAKLKKVELKEIAP